MGRYFLQRWSIKSNDETKSGKVQNFRESVKTISPTGNQGATSLPPIGDSFLYFHTSQNVSGKEIGFLGFDKTDIIRIDNVSFSYKRCSADGIHKAVGRFRAQLLRGDKHWEKRYTFVKKHWLQRHVGRTDLFRF